MRKTIILVALIALLFLVGVRHLNGTSVAPDVTNTGELTASTTPEKEPMTVPTAVLHPELVPVCGCESKGSPHVEPQQFNADGSVIEGPGNNWGMCQINATAHQSRADVLGIDFYTEEGNIQYANMLYKESGYAPWYTWSGHCWEDDPRINQYELQKVQ